MLQIVYGLLSLAIFLGKISTNKSDHRTCHIKGKEKKKEKKKKNAMH